jgi:peptidoglycan/LPS O-acetylase OafA/YrhL
MSKSIKSREIYLDFVRGIAILLAMGWHFNNASSGFWALDILLIPGSYIGWAGVDIFFVLSGFLIGGLIFKEFHTTGNFLVGRFLIRRAFKIWPILYVYLLLLLISGRYPWESFFFQNMFHVQNYFLTPLAHLWSLAVEEHFYIIFALGLMVFTRTKNKDLNLFATILPIILIVSPLLRIIAFNYFIDPHHIQIQTQYRIDALAFGIYLAYLNLFHSSKFEWISSQKIILAPLFLFGCVLLAYAKGNVYFKVTAGYTISYLTGGALLLYCHRLRLITEKNLIVNAIARIGVYSYAMYVYQFVMMRVIEALLKKWHITYVSGSLDLFIKYGGAICLAVLLTKLIEQPCLSLRERLFPSFSSKLG